ncbi:restriction endonuclease subunit S [Xanthomonas campestris pv. campestris]|uniref:restriction endonuclease subunit S n=1 Tax=Xanthomonas campestris TaxID=339 RepID=UPI002AD51E49|nr:restriction endonuclease subunit S [Xanthomonas campestris]MEA0636583.1 restriction endonuclease subunit S [Xanthomonas campestris pv. campestris]MEA0941001.1 restriction endonuclease subunit S [Xanthomonas campestris pv. campestris]MEA0961685.1 restriction endonuclease subunit S [Xanthomonas campestris pv. campestris]MEB1882501.1 restriction endonuclease subunit S [Xanthomonas campestris pv. campestris]MEB1927692.1 restriction endonuclease subunit S [Xanthomonas campestris pv. campestris]
MLPKGWTQNALRENIRIHSGQAPGNLDLLPKGEIPYVKVEDLNNCDKYQSHSREYLESCRSVVPAQSLIFPKRGAAIFANKIRIAARPIALDTNLMAVEIVKGLDAEYLYYAISFAGLHQLADTSTIPQLNNKHVLPYVLARPSLKEQRRIAHILSTWDQAIATTERLLKNSQKQMDILLRDLTLGTQRTTSTPSPWAKFTLGELGRTYSGLSGKKGEDFGFGAKFIPYTNVFKNNRIDIEDFSLVKISENENQTRVKSGDIIFTISSETPNEVGMASVLLDDVNELYLNSFCFGYRLNDFKTLLPEYAGFVLRAPHIRALMTQIAQGSTRFNISKANVMRMELALPSIAEQKRIASILGGAHSTVKNLRDQLARLKAEKVILMSQLLTGKRRVRLPADEAAHA